MKRSKDTRLSCPCCGARTWSTDYAGFMRDHDRPDGRVCREAQRQTVRGEILSLCAPDPCIVLECTLAYGHAGNHEVGP